MESLSIDLHGLTWAEAQEEFISFYNGALAEAGSSACGQLHVIHGYGSSGDGGLLGNRIRGLLLRFDDRLEFTPGEKLSGNPGVTIVTPLRRLPAVADLLEQEILTYCERPRSPSKISGKLRRHGSPKITQAIKSLQKQGRLRRLEVQGRIMYEAS